MLYGFLADITQSLNNNQGILAVVAIIEAAVLAMVGGKALWTKITVKNSASHAESFIQAGGGINAGGSINVGGTHNYGTSKPTQKQIAREVIIYLEDKRVLYNASQLENPDHCITAVIQIREFLTRTIKRLSDADELSSELRVIRNAARKFTDKDQDMKMHFGRGAGFDQEFFSALGEMRGVFGIYLEKIANRYALKVEDGLASIFTAESND